MNSRFRLPLFILTLAALVAAFAFSAPAQAQEGEDSGYVDVELILAAPDDIQASLNHDLDIVVVNNGSRTAYDVEVVLNVVYPEDSSRFIYLPVDVPIGTVSVENNGYTFRWSIPELGGLQREEVTPYAYHRVVEGHMLGTTFDNSLFPHGYSGEVTTASFDSNPANNTDRVWAYGYLGNSTSFRQVAGNYTVDVDVDDPTPSPGDTVNFTITADRVNPYKGLDVFGTGQGPPGNPPPIDLKVDIELTEGLTVTGTPTYAPAADVRAGSVSYSDGVFTIGTVGKEKERRNSVTLPITVASDAAVNEQCLTATLTGNPPPGNGPLDDDVSDNAAKLCLGGAPDESVIFASGQSDLLTLFACVGESTYPCGTADTVELASTGGTAAVNAGVPYEVFQPKNIVIQVLEPFGRTLSSNGVVRRTGHDSTDPRTETNAGNVPGVSTRLVRPSTGYNQYTLTIADATMGDESNPGNVKVALATNLTQVIFNTSASTTSFGPNNFNGPFQIIFEFTHLGTYIFDITASAEHGNPATEYEDDEPFTFHVGPIAELEVKEGEASSDATHDQVAFTVLATANGPDDPLDAEVTIDLSSLPTGVTVDRHIASDGTYSNGKWDLGALKSPDYRRAAGKPKEASLTLILAGDDAGDATATATISHDNTNHPYTVCIGSDGDTLEHTNQTDCAGDAATTNVWYAAVCVNTADGEVDSTITVEATCDSTTDRAWTENVCASSDGSVRAGRTETECGGWFRGTVYDHKDDNNTVTITAQAGTGGGGEGAPPLQDAEDSGASITVTWEPVATVHGVPVSRYEVQRETNPWEPVATVPYDADAETVKYVDTDVEPGNTYRYRVRAVNEAGVAGPWSQVIKGMVEGGGIAGLLVSRAELTIAEGDSAQYTVKLKERPTANVSVRVNGSGDVAPDPRRLTFTPSDWNTPQSVTLNADQDNDALDDTAQVTHSVSSSDSAYANLAVDPVAVSVIDDDSGVSIEAGEASVNEGEDIVLTLTRVGNTDRAITVTVNVVESGNYLASGEAGQRTVDMDAGVTTAQITVATDNDTTLESAGTIIATIVDGTGYFATSPSSATVRVQDDDGPPGQPGDLAAEERDGAVRLTWSAAPTGDAPVLDYYYRYKRSDRSITWDLDWTELPGGSGALGHTVHGLTNGQEYVFEVRARNATGDGPAAAVTANPKDEPGAPEVTVASRHESLLVTWNVADDGGRPTTEYRVQWKSGSESFDSSRQATATDRQYTIPNLTNDTEYRVRVQAMNEAGWSGWSGEQRGTPTPRPATSLSITAEDKDGNEVEDEVGKPFRVIFTFTDEDHDGTQYGVTGFEVDDIEAWYTDPTFYEFTLEDFREETPGLVYSAQVNQLQLLEGRLRISVAGGAATSGHDAQESTSAELAIQVDPPPAVEPTGREIWSAVMTVGDYSRNAVGYINPDLSLWDPDDTIGSLSDGDAFTHAGTSYVVGEISIVRDWNMILFISCPGLEGADASFDLFLDDQVEGNWDLSLSFDPDEVESSPISGTIDGDTQSCVEYRWTPQSADWKEGGTVEVSIIVRDNN